MEQEETIADLQTKLKEKSDEWQNEKRKYVNEIKHLRHEVRHLSVTGKIFFIESAAGRFFVDYSSDDNAFLSPAQCMANPWFLGVRSRYTFSLDVTL